MPSTTAPPLTWPTLAELDAVADCMGGEGGAMDRLVALKETMDLLVNMNVAPSVEDVAKAIERGAEPLTLEHVGALSSCLARLRFDLEYMLGEVKMMERQRDAMALEVVTPKEASDDA